MPRIFAMLFIVAAGAQALWSQGSKATWGDSQNSGYRESANTSLFTPGRYSFDGNESTYWQLESGSSQGWIEAYTSSARRYARATVSATIPSASKMTISVLSNNAYLPIPSGTIRGPFSGTKTLVFPGELPPTARVLIELSGQDAGEARIYEIKLATSGAAEPFGMIIPKSYTTNFSEYINIKASRLWNGINSSDWFEPLWYVPYEILQTDSANKPTAIFPPYFGNPPVSEGQIVWQLDGSYKIQLLKIYQIQAGRWVRFEFWVNGGWTAAQDFKNLWTSGWQRYELSSPVTTNKVRISFPGGWEQARYLGQIQVWGEGWSDTPSRPLALTPEGSDGYQQFTLDDVAQRNYSLSVSIPGSSATSLSGEWNGNPITLNAKAQVSGSTLFQAPLTATNLLSGQQFLKLATGGSATGVSLDTGEERGLIDLGSPWNNGYFDQSESASANPELTSKSWELNGAYQLEKLRVYMKGDNTPVFQTEYKRRKQAVAWTNTGMGWWEANLEGTLADTIEFRSPVAVSIDQIQLYGTPLTDKKVDIEIWWPRSSSDKPVSSSGMDGNSVIGWMGDSSVQPTINGYHPRQADKLFWMPLNQMGLTPGGRYPLTVNGALGGAAMQLQQKLYWWLSPRASLNQGTTLVTTTQDIITLSGTDAIAGSHCFINGIEVPVVGNQYSNSVALSYGYQIISVEIRSSNKKDVLVAWEKPVYRSIGSPAFVLDLPFGDTYTQSSTLPVTGRVGNGPGLSLTLNGQALSLSEDAFTYNANLANGDQILSFVLTDSLGRQTTRNLQISRDSTAPVISITAPAEGQYYRTPLVTLSITGGVDKQLWWSINGNDWEAGFIDPEMKHYSLGDGFYTYTAQAQDRAGNISPTSRVSFCVDTMTPAPFKIAANVSGWTNNNRPTISFATTDATSGIDRYTCSLDGGIATTIISPYRLPVLSDGTHTATVTAFDKAGNSTVESIVLTIDTAPPAAVQGLHVTPGDAQIAVAWSPITTDLSGIASYRITRSPAWPDGAYSLVTAQFTDKLAENGTSYTYTVWGIDKASNEGAHKTTEPITAGIAVSTVSETSPTVVQFDKTLVVIPAKALGSDITEVVVGEIPKTSLTDAPTNTIVSSIYRFVVTSVVDGVATQSDHAELSEEASVRIWYDPDLIPSSLSEANLKPCYYDSIWGRWIPLENGMVDTNSHSIMFSTDHFSDYSIQACSGISGNAAQLRSSSPNPFSTLVGQSAVVASPTSGTVSTTFTEAVLPGVNGFDLFLSRSYDTSTAQGDAPTIAPDGTSSQSAVPNIDSSSDGSYPWYMGQGWRLNFPYMKWSGSGLWVHDLDGGVVSFGQMKEISSLLSADEQTLTIVMENHEGSDTTIELAFEVYKESSTKPYWQKKNTASYKYKSATLLMRDGRRADFDAKGRIKTIYNRSRTNWIGFSYENASTTITQSLPQDKKRTVTVTYVSGSPQIQSITISADGEGYGASPTYTYNSRGELIQSSDLGGRTWKYGYTNASATTSQTATTSEYACPSPTSASVSLLSSVSGPGIGLTTVQYNALTNTYSDTYTYSTSSAACSVMATRMIAASINVALDDASPVLRTSTYNYTITDSNRESAGADRFYTSKSEVDDGRIIRSTEYSPSIRARVRLSQAPEAMSGSLFSSAGTWSAQDTVIPISPKTSLRASGGGTQVIETNEQLWDASTLRKISERNIRGEYNWTHTSYEYDGWGNCTSIIEKAIVGTRSTMRSTSMAYYNNDESLMPGFPAGFDLPASLSIPLSYAQKNLLAAKGTRIQGSDSANAAVPAEDITEYEAYLYNDTTLAPEGMLSKKGRWTGSAWAIDRYSYDAYGEIALITSPSGQITDYLYDYASTGSSFTVTITQKAVAQADGSTRDIITSKGYSLLQGTNLWSVDANGNTTRISYDALGRTIKIIEPADSNAQSPTTTVAYDDIGLISTVTTPLSATIEYDFDALGRLGTIKKTTGKTSPLAGASSETISTSLAYNGYDELVEICGPQSTLESGSGPLTKYTYDARGRIASVKAPGAIKAKTSIYDDSTNTVMLTDELENKKKQEYDWSGRVLSQSQKISGTVYTSSVYYDGAGRAIASIDANGNVSTVAYNEQGLKSSIRGQAREVTIAGATTTATPEVSISYNLDGTVARMSRALDQGGTQSTSYAYNGIGQVLTAQSSVTTDGAAKILKVTNTYDPVGNLLSQSSGYDSDYASGTAKTTALTYDSHSRVLTKTIGSGDSSSETMRYGYDAIGNRTSITDPRQAYTTQNGGGYTASFILTLNYDQLGRLVEAVLPTSAGSTATPKIQFLYDGRGNLIERREADGELRKYGYTQRSLLATSSLTDGATTYTTSYTYNDAGWPISIRSPSGRVDELSYDEAGRVLSQGNTVAGYQKASYDGNGNPVMSKDGKGNTTTYTYTPDNLAQSMTDAKGGVTRLSYDRWGQKIQSVDANGNTRTYGYDELGRLVSETKPWNSDSPAISYVYDAWGNVASSIDARGTRFARIFNAENHLTRETATSSDGTQVQTTSYAYDEGGDLKSSNNGVRTVYNLVNGEYQADPYGLTTGKTDSVSSNEIAMSFDYDIRQRITAITYPDASGVKYAYNQLDQLTSVMNASGSSIGSISYDSYGRMQSLGLANGVTKTLSYDSQDRLAGLSYSGGAETLAQYTYSYDLASNLVSKNGNSYRYDELNQLVGTSENGWFQKKPDEIRPTYTTEDRDYKGTAVLSFDVHQTIEENESSLIILDTSARSVGIDLGDEYGVNRIELHPQNANTRVRQKDLLVFASKTNASSAYALVTGWTMTKGTGGSLTLEFPKLFKARFLKILTIWDDRDIANKSISSKATFANSARELVKVWVLSSYQERGYSYDAVGNIVESRVDSKSRGYSYYQNQDGKNLDLLRHDGEWYYEYDGAGNRILKAKALLPGTFGREAPDTSQEYWQYGWDLYNRLIAVSKNGERIVSYTYDAENFRVQRIGKDGTTVYGYDRNAALAYQKNLTSGLTRTISYANGEILGWTDSQNGTSTQYYAVTDHLGSVTEVTDSAGKVVWKSEYTPFGVVAGIESSYAFSGMFAGQDIDSDTGLTYHWNRWRSEDGTRFISEDPAQDGLNWYAYVGNSPLCAVDPTGLYPNQVKGDDGQITTVYVPDDPSTGAGSSSGAGSSGSGSSGTGTMADPAVTTPGTITTTTTGTGPTTTPLTPPEPTEPSGSSGSDDSTTTTSTTPTRYEEKPREQQTYTATVSYSSQAAVAPGSGVTVAKGVPSASSANRFQVGADVTGSAMIGEPDDTSPTPAPSPVPQARDYLMAGFGSIYGIFSGNPYDNGGYKPGRAFRSGLIMVSGYDPGFPYQAHHAFPQIYRQLFLDNWGIYVDNPRYGGWWLSPDHQIRAYEYNSRWAAFFNDEPGASVGRVFEFARQLAAYYGYGVYF